MRLGPGFGLVTGGAWSPGRLPGKADSLSVAALRSAGKLFQDAGKTTRALADGDPVHVMSAEIDWTSSGTGDPVLHTDGSGHWWVTFDGVGNKVTASRTLTQPFAAWASIQRVGGSNCRVMDSAGRALFGGNAGNYEFFAGTTVLNAAGFDNAARVLGATFNGASSILYNDNAAVISGSNPGAAGTSGTITLGDDGSGGAFSNFKLFGLVTTSTVPSASDRALLFAYLKALHP